MRIVKKIITAKIAKFSELSLDEKILLTEAAKARKNAQAPYSNYLVGVAIRIAGGLNFIGCNVERCSYTQTTHAEQNAADSMVAALGPAESKISAVALVAAPRSISIELPPRIITKKIKRIGEVPVPCGHCLQIIWENCFGDSKTKLIALAEGGEIVITTIGDAFPMRFGPNDLGIDYKKSHNPLKKRGVFFKGFIQ